MSAPTRGAISAKSSNAAAKIQSHLKTTNISGSKSDRGVQSAASVQSHLKPVARSYKLRYSGKEYSLSQDDVSWLKSAYESTFEDHYGFDDEDQERRKNRVMPYSYQKGYKDTTLDRQLYEIGLPSSKYIEKYIEQLCEYKTQAAERDSKAKRVEQFYSDVAAKWLQFEHEGKKNDDVLWSDDDGVTQYTGRSLCEKAFFDALSSESWADVRGLYSSESKASDIDPAKYGSNVAYQEALIRAMNKDAAAAEKEIDDYGLSMPSVSYADFQKRFGEYRKKFLEAELAEDAVFGKYTGSQYLSENDSAYRKQKYDSILSAGSKSAQKSAARAFVRDTDVGNMGEILKEMFDAGVQKSVLNDARNQMLSHAKGDDDAISKINGAWESIQAAYATDRAGSIPVDAAVFGKASVISEIIGEGEWSARLGDGRESVFNYIKEHGGISAASLEGAFADLDAAGFSPAEARVVLYRLRTSAVVSGDDTLAAYNRLQQKYNDAVRLEAQGGARNIELDNILTRWQEDYAANEPELTSISLDEACSIMEQYIVYGSNGVINKDSLDKGLRAVADAGASTGILMDLGAALTGGSPTSYVDSNGFILDNTATAAAYAATPQDSYNSTIIYGSVYDLVNETRMSNIAEASQPLREQLLSQGYTGWEIDQAFGRKGWQEALDREQYAKDYYKEVEAPSIHGQNDGFNSLSPEDQAALISRSWEELPEETKSAYIENFNKNYMFNASVNKSHEQQSFAQWGAVGARAIVNAANGFVSFADAVSTAVSGKQELWDVTKQFNTVAGMLNAYGKAVGQDLTSDVISASTDIASEIMRMYLVNGVGTLAGSGLAHLAGASSLTTEAINGLNGISRFIGKAATKMSTASFVTNAVGASYAEAMQGGAEPSEALAYGLVCGGLEGVLESLSFESLWGKALGSERFGAMLLDNGRRVMKGGGVVAKARLVNLAASFLGEASEEGLGYVASYVMQSTQGWGDAEFSIDELRQNMLMGGIIGLLGSGLQMGNINQNSILQEYMRQNGDYGTSTVDLLMANAWAQAHTAMELQQAQDMEGGGFLDIASFKNVVSDLNQNLSAQQAAQEKYNKAVNALENSRKLKRLKGKRDAAKTEFIELIGYDITSTSDDIADARQRYADASAAYDKAYASARADVDSAYNALMQASSTTFAQAVQKAQAKLDSHWANMYTLFADDIAAMVVSAELSPQAQEKEKIYNSSADLISAMLSDGKSWDPLLYVQETQKMLDAQKALAASEPRLKTARDTLSKTAEKAAEVRTGKRGKKEKQKKAEQTAPAFSIMDEPRQQRVLDFAARINLDGKVVIDHELPQDKRGYYDPATGVLHINALQYEADASGDFLLSPEGLVVKHELTHYLENSGFYDSLSQNVLRYIEETKGQPWLDAKRLELADTYRKAGEELTPAGVDQEIVANACAELFLTNEEAIRRLAREDAGIGGRILNWIQYKLASIKGAFSGETRAESFLRDAERYYIRAFATTGINPAALNVQQMITGPAGISRAAALGWDIDKWDGSDGFARSFMSDHADADGNLDVSIKYDRFNERKVVMLYGSTYKLTEFLDHPRLYQLYPELRNVTIRYKETLNYGNATFGSYNAKNNCITIYSTGAASFEIFSDTLLHEVQHAVQHIERDNGYSVASGSNTSRAKALLASEDLARLAAAVRNGDMTKEEAIKEAARRLSALGNKSRALEISDAYRNDLGEQEARATGETWDETNLWYKSDEAFRENAELYSDSDRHQVAESIHNYYPPFISGDAEKNFASITDSLDTLFEGGLTKLREMDKNNSISENERVILNVAENAEQQTQAHASQQTSTPDKDSAYQSYASENWSEHLHLGSDKEGLEEGQPTQGDLQRTSAHMGGTSIGSEQRDLVSTPPGASSISEEALAATPLSEVVDSFRADPANEESVAALRKRIELAPIDEILGLPVFKDAISASAYSAADETNRIHTPEREALREEWKNRLSESGSYSEKTVDGRKVKGYDGVVKNEGIAFIIIGPSAAGKSTIADPISQNYSARIYDSDVVKQMIPEFDDGYGAGRVHEESSEVMFDAFHRDAGTRVNMVIPIVGGKESSVMKYKDVLDANGYKTYLVLNELDSEKAAKRAAARFLTTGRFVDPQMVYNQLDNPTKVFQALEQKGDFNGYEHYSNDVEFGQSPVLVSGTGEIAGIGGGVAPENGGERAGRMGSQDGAAHSTRRMGEIPQGAARSVGAHLPKRLSNGPKYYIGNGKSFFVDADQKYMDAAQQYGAIEQGMAPRARDEQVPRKVDDTHNVSKFVRSMAESQHIPQGDLSELRQRVAAMLDGYAYETLKNDNVLESARNEIASLGTPEAISKIVTLAADGKAFRAQEIAIGLQLIADAAERGDSASVYELVSSMGVAATKAGQAVQVFSMLKKLGGVGEAMYVQKVVDRINAVNAKKGRQKITVPKELMAALAQARTPNEIQLAEDAISKHIGQSMNPTLMEALSNWRYFSMLSAPITHMRNFTGNVLGRGMAAGKNVVAAGFESLRSDDGYRAHAVYNRARQQAAVARANISWIEHQRDVSGGGKFGFEQSIAQNKRLSSIGVINAAEKFVSNALEFCDDLFLKLNYVDAYTQFLVANKITPADITPEQDALAVQWATSEAQRATYRDASHLASMIQSISDSGIVGQVIVEGVMPFKKTPINVAKRAVDYSPVGVINGLYQLYQASHGKNASPLATATAIDRISAGAVGTSLMAIGMILAKAGLLRGAGEDEDAVEKYLTDTGEQAYSLRLGDVSINLSQLAPATVPLLMGARLWEGIDSEGEVLSLSDILETATTMFDPLTEMSFLSGVNDVLNNTSGDGPADAIGAVVSKALRNYASQYVPTVGGKIANIIDDTKRTTKSAASSKESLGGTVLDQYGRSIAQKIPGLSFTNEPYVTVKGERITQDNFGEWALEFANQFILPANVNIVNRDSVDERLITLYEQTGSVDVFPTLGEKTLRANGKQYNMTAQEYTDYCEARGTASYAAIKAVMSSDTWNHMTPDERAAAIKRALEAAEAQVRNQFKERFGLLD